QTAFHDDTSLQWPGQYCAQTLVESNYIGHNGSELRRPSHSYSLREVGRQRRLAGDEAAPDSYLDRQTQQGGGRVLLLAAEDNHGVQFGGLYCRGSDFDPDRVWQDTGIRGVERQEETDGV